MSSRPRPKQPDADDAAAGVELDPDRVVAPRDQLLGQPQPAQDLQGARLDGQRARLVHPVQLPVDDANGRPERLELGGQGEAGRSGPDDQDVERVAVGGGHVRAARVARQRRAARPASVTRVRLALAATMTGAHIYDPGLVSAWPVMMPSRVRSATTAARAATAAAVGGRVARSNDSAEPAAQPAGGGDGQAQRWTGDRQGQADQRERQPWADQLVAPWRQGVDHDRGDPGQPDQRPGDQQAELPPDAPAPRQAPDRTRRRRCPGRRTRRSPPRSPPPGSIPAPGGSRGLP